MFVELPERDLKRIAKLLIHLSNPEGVPPSVDLSQATLVPLWMVQRYREASASYGIWAASDAVPDIPWAYIPCPRKLSRADTVAFLREHWAPDARRTLERHEDET